MNFLKALMLAAVLAAGARAEAPAQCVTPAEFQEKAAAEQKLKPAVVLEGERAAALATAMGAEWKASHIVIYVIDETVILVAFEGGCYKAVASVPLGPFRMAFPDAIPEAK